MEQKLLTINGIIFAKYNIENNKLYLKVEKYLKDVNALYCENIFIYLIQSIEGVKFHTVCYLNV